MLQYVYLTMRGSAFMLNIFVAMLMFPFAMLGLLLTLSWNFLSGMLAFLGALLRFSFGFLFGFWHGLLNDKRKRW